MLGILIQDTYWWLLVGYHILNSKGDQEKEKVLWLCCNLSV